MRVMLGGCTCSIAASSPSVIGPSASMVVSAASRDAVRSSPALVPSCRTRRARRATASRSALARPAGEIAGRAGAGRHPSD